jgi:RNA polymerase sigma-70 factor (ECF subfamily)
MDQRSDGELLDAWHNADALAFEALVLRYQGPLLRHSRALLGDRRGCEDVVQEALIRLAKKPPVLPEGVRNDPRAQEAVLAAWLHQVTRNLCMDVMRREKRRARREAEVAVEGASSGGIGDVESRDTRAAVERSLLQLPPEQREVLVLRLLGERSYKEIAEITGRKIGTVGWMISVGLQQLAAELAPLIALEPGSRSRFGAHAAQAASLQGGPTP